MTATAIQTEGARTGPTPRWTPFRYHAAQTAAWTCPAQFVALPCGRRAGKTELAKRRLVRYLPVSVPACVHPRYVFAGPTQDQARDIAWQDLLDLIPDHWIPGGKHGRYVSYSRLELCTKWGSLLKVVGLDKPHRIEGKYLNGIVLDESSDLRPGVFDRTVLPMLGDYGGWAWRIGVPKRQGLGAAEYRRFCEACAKGDYRGGAMFSWPASDILPEEAVRHARETLDPKDYAEQYDARWQTAGGGIFYAFDRQFNVRECTRRDNLPILVGSDFNVDPMCWVLAQKIGDRLDVFDEIWLRDANTPRTLDVLWGRYGEHPGGWQFYGDASGQARKTSAVQSDYAHIWNDERFKKAGRTVHYPAANPPVEDRFSAANARFCNAAEERRLFIDPRCRRLIDDIENRAYKQGTREPADSGDIGHMSDGLSYIVYRLWPIRFHVGGTSTVVAGAT